MTNTMRKKITKPKRTIDLHGVSHSDVNKILENFYLWKGKGLEESIIITGNSTEMRKLVFEFLDAHDFKYIVWAENLGQINVIG
jgi:hypothetical protein